MIYHYHLIYTPKGLADLLEESLPYDRYVSFAELGAGGLHFHTYIETEYGEDKIRDTLKDKQKIPAGQRGKRSLHYSVRQVAEHPEDYPDQDLRKFTLGYIRKGNHIKFCKGFTADELMEASQYYDSQRARRVPPQETLFPAEGLSPRQEKDDEWLEYVVHFEKWYSKLNGYNDTLKHFQIHARKFWYRRNNGKFPVGSKQRCFMQSIRYRYFRRNIPESEDLEEDVNQADELNLLN